MFPQGRCSPIDRCSLFKGDNKMKKHCYPQKQRTKPKFKQQEGVLFSEIKESSPVEERMGHKGMGRPLLDCWTGAQWEVLACSLVPRKLLYSLEQPKKTCEYSSCAGTGLCICSLNSDVPYWVPLRYYLRHEDRRRGTKGIWARSAQLVK